MSLTIVPIAQDEANAFVLTHHRHHHPLRVGYVFCIAVADELGCIHGVAIVGRPCARGQWDGWTLEVRRVATDGTPNACSCLYGASWRAARALGYHRLITYTLSSEPGISLRASGWRLLGERSGRSWGCVSRPRVDKHPTQTKLLWEAQAK